MQLSRLVGHTQRLVGPEQMPLADDVVQIVRTHQLRERRRRLPGFEQISHPSPLPSPLKRRRGSQIAPRPFFFWIIQHTGPVHRTNEDKNSFTIGEYANHNHVTNLYQGTLSLSSLSARLRGDKGTLEAQQRAGVRWVASIPLRRPRLSER